MSNQREDHEWDTSGSGDGDGVDAVEAGRPTRKPRPFTDQPGGDGFWVGAEDSGDTGAVAAREREIAESGDGQHGGTREEGLDPTEPFRPAQRSTSVTPPD